MRIFITLFSVLLPALSFADFQAYQVAPCSFWMPAQNGVGFVCQNIPGLILVPEAHSTAKDLKDLNDRLRSLEQKLTELSTSCKK